MKDMLVKLYDLPEVCSELEELKKTIDFRRPLAAEKYIICDWVEKNFGKGWMSETEVSFSKTPISTFVAIKKNKIIGFCTYESAYLNFLGPMGVEKKKQKKRPWKSPSVFSIKSYERYGLCIFNNRRSRPSKILF